MADLKQAVILAGGLGKRLKPLTNTVPKPMVAVRGKPFLEYLINLLKKNGISKVVILVGYLHEQIEEYFGTGESFGIVIEYSYSPVDADTGTRIKNALHLLQNEFLLLYGDNYWPLNLKDIYKYYKKNKVNAIMTVYLNTYSEKKNNIFVDENSKVKIYDRKRLQRNLNGIDIGFFIFRKELFRKLPKQDFSFEDIILNRLVKKTQLAAFITHHKYYSLTTPERLLEFEAYLQPRKIVFLDRDGVINKRPAKGTYVTHWREFQYLPDAIKGLQLLQKKRFELFIISNQAGIARKLLTRKQADGINKNLLSDLKKNEIKISDVFICPHGWNEGCFCRKPNPGMFFEAAQKYNIDLFKTFYIGDDKRDMIAGKAAGSKVFLVTPKRSIYDIACKLE